MADYTFTIYELMQNNFDFGLNDYPIFDEEYREILNNAILEHYKFREIGFQNPYLWRDRLRERMSLIMRNKYNELYKNKLVEFNPLHNIDLTETFTHEVKQNDTTTSDNLGLTSIFPSEEMTENNLSDNLFVDNATKNKTSDTSNGTVNETYTRTNKGSSAGLPFSRAMLQFKDFVAKYDLDNQVIRELSDLFITIW